MAQPTALNDQISDSVAQTNTATVAEAPAMGMATLYQGLSHSTALLFEASVGQFQQLGIAAQAATNQGVIQIYSMCSMASAVATRRIAQGPASLADLVAGERLRRGL